jgi:hypothetical protein
MSAGPAEAVHMKIQQLHALAIQLIIGQHEDHVRLAESLKF